MNSFNTMHKLKRLAIVAVSALGIGLLSAAPSPAANSVLEFVSGDGLAGTDKSVGYGVAGSSNYVTLRTTGSVAADYVVTTTTSFGVIDSGTVTDNTRTSFGSGATTRFQVMTPAVGTITVQYWVRTNGILAASASESVVITVRSSQQSGVFSATNSSMILADGETSTVGAVDAVVLKEASYNAVTAAGTVKVILKDGNGAIFNDTVTATTISGPALVNGVADSATVGSSFAAVAGQYSVNVRTTDGVAYFGAFSNGQAGIATISFRLTDGTVLGTKSLTFASTTASTISATTKKSYVLAGSNTADVFAVVVKDVSGYTITSGTVTATPVAGSLVATAPTTQATYDATAGAFLLGATGAAADKFGSVQYTFTHSSTTLVKATASTTFSAGVAASLTIAGPDSATPGEKVTFTLTAKDANGFPVANGTYEDISTRQLFAATEYSASGLAPFANGETVTLVNGVATSVAYMPFVAGKYTAKWTLFGTAGTASGALAAGVTGKEIPVVVNVAQATDAKTNSAIELLTAQVIALQTLVTTQQAGIQAQIDAAKVKAEADRRSYVAKYNALAKKWNKAHPKSKIALLK